MSRGSTTKKNTNTEKKEHQMSTETTPEITSDVEANLRNQAYYRARRDLVEKYQDEYRESVLAHAKELGVEVTFRKSAAERAEEQMQKLLAEHPELRDKLASA